MSEARLGEELQKLTPIIKASKVQMWVTQKAELLIKPKSAEDLLSVMIDAYDYSARMLGRRSEPFSMGHYENPDLVFVGTRLRPSEPYFFVVQAVSDMNWLRLMTDAYLETNKR